MISWSLRLPAKMLDAVRAGAKRQSERWGVPCSVSHYVRLAIAEKLERDS